MVWIRKRFIGDAAARPHMGSGSLGGILFGDSYFAKMYAVYSVSCKYIYRDSKYIVSIYTIISI